MKQPSKNTNTTKSILDSVKIYIRTRIYESILRPKKWLKEQRKKTKVSGRLDFESIIGLNIVVFEQQLEGFTQNGAITKLRC